MCVVWAWVLVFFCWVVGFAVFAFLVDLCVCCLCGVRFGFL